MRHPPTGFESIPLDLSRADLFRYFTYSEKDKQQIGLCRGAQNRIGFALLLGAVRLTGRFPYDFELLPRQLLSHVCSQLGLDVLLFLKYPQRRSTRHEHTERLKSYLGLRSFTQADQLLVTAHVRQRVHSGVRPHELLSSTEQMLRQHHIVLPGVTVLKRLIGTAQAKAEQELYEEIIHRIDNQTKQRVLALLDIPPGAKLNLFQQLQQAAGRPSPNALGQELDALERVRALLPETFDPSDFDPHLLEYLANVLSGATTRLLRQFPQTKRIALLLCWLWRLRTQLIDTALTISNELIAGVFRRVKNAFNKEQQRRHKRIGSVLHLCSEVVALLLDEAVPDQQLRAVLFERWSRQQIDALSVECKALAYPADLVYVDEVKKRYGYVRQFAPRMLETFVLRAVVPNEPLLKAIDYLRERNQAGQRGLDANVPLEFIPAAWQPHMCPEPGVVDRALWEICLLEQLRQALKSGNVHVPHSRAFQPIETYLISREQWEQERVALTQEHQLPLDYAQHWPRLAELLTEQLRLLDQNYVENPHLEMRDGQFHVARVEKFPIPDSARELKNTIRRMLQRRHLSDLLLEVHGWTNFLSAFTWLASGRPVTMADTSEQIALLACLIAEGCNIGLSDMAVIGPGISYEQLEEVHAHYLREETLAQATAILVNFLLRQPLSEVWGQGLTSSSDAQVYGVPIRVLNATFHPKYFASAGRGINVYTHVSDLWIPFYTQIITCHARQAPYILDGLLYHATHLEPREHYTDTHGYTELIFAVCHLLGIRFAPRIKGLPEQRLWRLPNEGSYQHIEEVFAGKLNVNLIRESWDEMIRLVASIKSGEVRASLILSKLTAASHRNKLFRGLQELGRLVKTAYIAEYLRSEDLRRRVLLGLNKGESLHSLARKLFFGGQGEIRDRTYEDQLNAVSSLNLLLACIIVWNTLHIQACVRRLRADGQAIDDSDLRHISPLQRRHLGIYGQYSFDVRRYGIVPAPESIVY